VLLAFCRGDIENGLGSQRRCDVNIAFLKLNPFDRRYRWNAAVGLPEPGLKRLRDDFNMKPLNRRDVRTPPQQARGCQILMQANLSEEYLGRCFADFDPPKVISRLLSLLVYLFQHISSQPIGWSKSFLNPIQESLYFNPRKWIFVRLT
jgi:hypothetical protein